jgi:hydroxyacyl-ACP dehydratase HTD2-like protein with hotdog domain
MKISALVHAPQFTLRTRFRGWSTILVRRFSSEGLQSSLQDELTSRKPNIIFDYISPTPSHLLNIALTDVLPKSCYPDGFLKHNNLEPPWQGRLPQGHHLVYFAPQIPGNQLLADGTDPLQSPGEPFVRRMWAGGGLQFDNSPTNQVSIGSERICCIESILDVVVKGVEPEEKIFVTIKREIGNQDMGYSNAVDTKLTRPWAVLETRDLVFMRQKTAAAIKEDAAAAGKVLKRMELQSKGVTSIPIATLLIVQ